MEVTEYIEEIVMEACERYLHQMYPEFTNLPDLREGRPATFRKAANQEPIGFHYEGFAIETQPVMVHGLIRLHIFAIDEDGRGHLIMGDIIPEEKTL